MKNVVTILLMGLLAGCAMDGVQGQAGKAIETKSESGNDRVVACSHTDQPVYKFENFSDGHHYLFDRRGKLQASVNTKGGVLCGAFEIYNFSGTREYWGVLDDGGHVINGKYNEYTWHDEERGVRDMSEAEKQNVQSKLEKIMRTGIDKMNEAQKRNSRQNAEAKERENRKMLCYYALAAGHPVEGEEYIHDGKQLQVIQVADGCVLVQHKDAYSPVEVKMHGYLDIIVETSKKYVDDEMLMAGKYIYIGPWTYTTEGGQKSTISGFKEAE